MTDPLVTPLHPAALLLTGGSSRRMGRDKATLMVGGQQLAARIAALLVAVADPVIEVGPGFTSLAWIREDPPGEGPLAAVAAGSTMLTGERPTLVVATDLPLLTKEFLEQLATFPAPSFDYCVIPYDASGRAQPLCARYSPAALGLARELVATGHRSMRALLDRVVVIPLPLGADHTLYDLDTPADLDHLDRVMRL